jgi:hypothetical protein
MAESEFMLRGRVKMQPDQSLPENGEDARNRGDVRPLLIDYLPHEGLVRLANDIGKQRLPSGLQNPERLRTIVANGLSRRFKLDLADAARWPQGPDIASPDGSHDAERMHAARIQDLQAMQRRVDQLAAGLLTPDNLAEFQTAVNASDHLIRYNGVGICNRT